MNHCPLTVSSLRCDEALLCYIMYAGQISSLFVAGSQSVSPHLFDPLQVVAVTRVGNPVTGTENGLVIVYGQRLKTQQKLTTMDMYDNEISVP